MSRESKPDEAVARQAEVDGILADADRLAGRMGAKIVRDPDKIAAFVHGAAHPAPEPVEGIREKVFNLVLEAVFTGYEHGSCEKEWEPDYGKEIANDTTQRILALQSRTGGLSNGE